MVVKRHGTMAVTAVGEKHGIRVKGDMEKKARAQGDTLRSFILPASFRGGNHSVKKTFLV